DAAAAAAERSALLAGAGPNAGYDADSSNTARHGANGVPRDAYTPAMSEMSGAYSEQKEQEKLRRLVQKTAEKLIDISSIRLLDRIQEDQAQERAGHYHAIIKDIPNLVLPVRVGTPGAVAGLGTTTTGSSSSSGGGGGGGATMPLEAIVEALAEPTRSLRREDVEFAADALAQVRAALATMEVQNAGEIVVALR
ncbi:hypothetical protein DFJ73DRAFT_826592, partial [Zopfochytrium polystomum]